MLQTLQLSHLRRDSHDFGLNLKLTRLSLKTSHLKFLTHSLALQEEVSLRDELHVVVPNTYGRLIVNVALSHNLLCA